MVETLVTAVRREPGTTFTGGVRAFQSVPAVTEHRCLAGEQLSPGSPGGGVCSSPSPGAGLSLSRPRFTALPPPPAGFPALPSAARTGGTDTAGGDRLARSRRAGSCYPAPHRTAACGHRGLRGLHRAPLPPGQPAERRAGLPGPLPAAAGAGTRRERDGQSAPAAAPASPQPASLTAPSPPRPPFCAASCRPRRSRFRSPAVFSAAAAAARPRPRGGRGPAPSPVFSPFWAHIVQTFPASAESFRVAAEPPNGRFLRRASY